MQTGKEKKKERQKVLKEKSESEMIMTVMGGWINVPAHFLGSSLVEFYLINSPYCTLDILNSHETFVKTKIMSNCVLCVCNTRETGSISVSASIWRMREKIVRGVRYGR